MTDQLLHYYNEELYYIRQLAAEFSKAHPKIASRLKIGSNQSVDPHVERLIEAFAFLNARIRSKLDDDFPELNESLLGLIYPHYLAPIPAMAIVQFKPQHILTEKYTVARGSSIQSQVVDGSPCRFTTCYPVEVWPIEISAAVLSGLPLMAPALAGPHNSQACLCLTLRSTVPHLHLADINPGKLRFFLAGQPQQTAFLYEALFNNTITVVLASHAKDTHPIILTKDAIKAVGFAEDEGLLPYPAHSFIGYRLLTEYFHCPDKFLFFDLQGLTQENLALYGEEVKIYFYLNKASSLLEKQISADNFLLGCTPIVNLFKYRAEPLQLTHTQSEYRIVPNARSKTAYEIYSITQVMGIGSDETEQCYLPFYGLKHGDNPDHNQAFWHATRRAANPVGTDSHAGTEMTLHLVDLNFQPAVPNDTVILVDTYCTNRDLPNRLPFGGGQPLLQLDEGAGPMQPECITPFSRVVRPPLGNNLRWRLISHLALNHLSLGDTSTDISALQEILQLYNFDNSMETQATIKGIEKISHRRIVARAPEAAVNAFCQGLEITIEFDPQQYNSSNLLLFANVLEQFLSLYCSINSFVKLVATLKGQEGIWKAWPARIGEKHLV